VRPELQAMIRLQLIDQETVGLGKDLDKIPELIATEKKFLHDFEEEVKETEVELESMQKFQRDIEGEIQLTDQKLRESKGKQTQVKTNSEFGALTHEIESFQKKILELEDQVLECMEALEPLRAKVEESRKGLEAAKNTVQMAVRKHEVSLARLKDELDKSRRGRESAWAEVGSDWQSRYESIRKGRGGLAVVPIIDRNCQGCRMNETIQRFFEIRDLKDEIFSCSSCARIVYYKESEAVGTAAPTDEPD
jgi:predicted  nucleic acid-binding Zn-ribbon protein